MLDANVAPPTLSYRGAIRTWPSKRDTASIVNKNVVAAWIVYHDFVHNGVRLPVGWYILHWPLAKKWHICRDMEEGMFFMLRRYSRLVYREPIELC